MSILLKTLELHLPQAIAVRDGQTELTYAQLREAVESLSTHIQPCQCVAILLDNSAAWVVADLATLALDCACIPIPGFFSAEQIQHVLADAGVDVLLSAQPLPGCEAQCLDIAGQSVFLQRLNFPAKTLPPRCAKITYTSGTTSQPKGVCLSEADMLQVARSILQGSQTQAAETHLCTLPLSLLLANISAVYAPLLIGGCANVPSLGSLGWRGASGLDVQRLLANLQSWKANSSVFVPQMLQALIAALSASQQRLSDLRFLAVGGAPIAQSLLNAAQALGLPVFEGYGLSECSSVVCMNTETAHKPGSVGKPLPHVDIHIDEHGELWVKGPQLLAYLNHPLPTLREGFLATGDLAYQDEDGFVFLSGRKKTCFITAFGRNVAPEWVENALCAQPAIGQALVYGEALPENFALLMPRNPSLSTAQISAAVRAANQYLPDYAQVRSWLLASEFYPQGFPSSPGGTPRRAEIHALLQQQGLLPDNENFQARAQRVETN